MATFTFSDEQFVPIPPKREECERLTLPQRSVISQLDKHLRLPVTQQLRQRQLIVITGESVESKKQLLKHMLFLLDTAAHTTTDFTYLHITPGAYLTKYLGGHKIATFGGLPCFYEEYNGRRRIRLEWGRTMGAVDLCEVKLVLIEDLHAISANDFSCLEYYLRRIARGTPHSDSPFANRTVICMGNIFSPSPLTDDSLLFPSNGPWAVLGKNPHELFKGNITKVYFLNESSKGESTDVCLDYKGFLDRLKIGNTTLEDHAKIKARMIKQLTANEIASFRDVPRVFVRIDDAEEFAKAKAIQDAQANIDQVHLNDMADKILKVTNGFEKLYLTTGCKVILTRDIDLSDCLKAGCVGVFWSAYFNHSKPTSTVNEIEVKTADIKYLFVNFPCSRNGEYAEGIVAGESLRGNLIKSYMTTAYFSRENRNKFVRAFPLVPYCATTHAALQNIETIPRLAIKLGRNEVRESQDYSVFSKLRSFKDFMILDCYLSMSRLKVMEDKKTERAKEYDRLVAQYEDKCFKGNITNYLVHRSLGGRARPQRSRNVTLAKKNRNSDRIATIGFSIDFLLM